jgi:gamma-glutamyl:cysteine ligase YbdK (ATP-grasp superfamily)
MILNQRPTRPSAFGSQTADECRAVRPGAKWLGMEFEIKPLRKACRTLKKDRHVRKAIDVGCPIGREFGRVVAGAVHELGLAHCFSQDRDYYEGKFVLTPD